MVLIIINFLLKYKELSRNKMSVLFILLRLLKGLCFLVYMLVPSDLFVF